MDIYQNPIVFKIHRGTVRSDANLCVTCRNCHRTVEAGTGREDVTCNATYGVPRRIRGPIAECTHHQDKTKPTLSDMHDIAWTLMTDKGGRKIGFQSPEQRRNESESTPPKIGF